MQDIIVVGSGFSGSILARKIAEELNQKVCVIEKRLHIGGNAYDEMDENGILIQKYGPHFLNTNKYFIIQYLMQFAELFPHNTKLLSFIDGSYVRLPFNFETVQQLIGSQKAELLLAKLRAAFLGRDRVPILELVDHEDQDVSSYGNLLFEKAYRTYTAKMWDVDVDAIEKSVLERVPMAMNYDERYLNKDFQYLPKKGFTKLFEKLLDHPNIEIQLGVDAMEKIRFNEMTKQVLYNGVPVKCLIFTGAVDELFGRKYGSLPYRSLNIQYAYNEADSVLPAEIVSYPQADGYIRSTEYRKIMFDQNSAHGSIVATEYPLWYDPDSENAQIPYYPVLTEESNTRYQKYLTEAMQYSTVFLCGRLAEFKYYNMDVCIEHALEYFNAVKEYIDGLDMC